MRFLRMILSAMVVWGTMTQGYCAGAARPERSASFLSEALAAPIATARMTPAMAPYETTRRLDPIYRFRLYMGDPEWMGNLHWYMVERAEKIERWASRWRKRLSFDWRPYVHRSTLIPILRTASVRLLITGLARWAPGGASLRALIPVSEQWKLIPKEKWEADEAYQDLLKDELPYSLWTGILRGLLRETHPSDWLLLTVSRFLIRLQWPMLSRMLSTDELRAYPLMPGVAEEDFHKGTAALAERYPDAGLLLLAAMGIHHRAAFDRDDIHHFPMLADSLLSSYSTARQTGASLEDWAKAHHTDLGLFLNGVFWTGSPHLLSMLLGSKDDAPWREVLGLALETHVPRTLKHIPPFLTHAKFQFGSELYYAIALWNDDANPDYRITVKQALSGDPHADPFWMLHSDEDLMEHLSAAILEELRAAARLPTVRENGDRHRDAQMASA